MDADNKSPAEPTPEPELLARAREKFGTLSVAEEKLFRAAQEGRIASALTGDENKDDPAHAANWPADRVVRAKCIAWVCTEPKASVFITYQGLEFRGMRIDGELNLNNAEMKFSFRARECAFSEKISLRDAKLQGFYLNNCRVRSLFAGRATIDGPVLLRGSFKAEGEINLVGATISGDLDCDGGEFSNANGFALNANRAKVEGSVFLRNGFTAEGEVNLISARIGGNLECDGGQFSKDSGPALTANTANIEGGVYLRDGFRAEGQVNLVAATIGNLQIRDVKDADQMTLDLRLTKAETFWDDERSWPKPGNLFLDGFHYERLDGAAPFESDRRKKWLRLQPRDRYRPQPYEQLSSVLRQMGHERHARLVTIEKNHERASFTRFPRQGWWWYNLFGKLIGYGHRPGRAFCISLAMILLGTILFYLGSIHDLISPTSESAYVKEPSAQLIEENRPPKISEKYPVFNAFFYSLESFTPLLKLDQSANWTPNANHGSQIPLVGFWAPRIGEILRYYLYFHIAAGWLLTSLWVGAITGLVKT